MGSLEGGGDGSAVSSEMLVYCWEVLAFELGAGEVRSEPRPAFPNSTFPLFVTWKTSREQRLRGCIGTFTPTPLHHGLAEYSLTAALKDSRFEPIRADELPRLHCSISLLTNFEPAQGWSDWTLGLHGIRIEFPGEKNPSHKKTATYLPQVPLEQGWDHLQTIDSLLRKGGFKGTICPKVRDSISLVRFQSEKGGLSYAQFSQLRQGHRSNGTAHLNGHVS